MKSAEQAFGKVASTIKYTISKSIEENQTIQIEKTNQSTSLPEQTNVFLQSPAQSKWTLASYESSSYVKPVEMHCEVGTVLRVTFCGKTEYA